MCRSLEINPEKYQKKQGLFFCILNKNRIFARNKI
ncbi:hypothetical protein EVA_10622 [gut metagenome]|uniref:Uncharacterized protein n=1 Tax=gut metagenome TaxID=749906 RepID=J9G352_9ZZZZ